MQSSSSDRVDGFIGSNISKRFVVRVVTFHVVDDLLER